MMIPCRFAQNKIIFNFVLFQDISFFETISTISDSQYLDEAVLLSVEDQIKMEKKKKENLDPNGTIVIDETVSKILIWKNFIIFFLF